jgi:hypothetical protein
VKKILSIVVAFASFVTSIVNAQVVLKPHTHKHFAAQSIPLDFYKKSAHAILKRFNFKNTKGIRAYLQQRIEVIHVACSQTEDSSLLSQEYALLDAYSDLKLPEFFEDCFWWTVVDCAQEYANAYIRLMCDCIEKNFHVQLFELSNLLEGLPVVSHAEVEEEIAAKISNTQIMRIHVRQFSKLARALIEEMQRLQTLKTQMTTSPK